MLIFYPLAIIFLGVVLFFVFKAYGANAPLIESAKAGDFNKVKALTDKDIDVRTPENPDISSSRTNAISSLRDFWAYVVETLSFPNIFLCFLYLVPLGFVVSLVLRLFGYTSISINVSVIILVIRVIGILYSTFIVYSDLKCEYEKVLEEKEALYLEEKEALGTILKEKTDEVELLKSTLKERSSGYPSLYSALSKWEQREDVLKSRLLYYKRKPAPRASEILTEETRRRRDAEFALRKTGSIIEYYESIAPFLLDFKDEIVEDEDDDAFRDYNDEEKQDPAIRYLAKEEYRKLPPVERNQLALDRFLSRPKSKRMIGKMYERYVGYLYEMEGYQVDYVGIFHGKADLGRDLICRRGAQHVIVQCKNWSQFKTIYEKHIFQFFGTVFQYRRENPFFTVSARFYTTTQVSDLARQFARELGLEIIENHCFDQTYPCIKCNISKRNREKIYHLPFDQQYDTTRIEIPEGEFYCSTVKTAEEAGFRRAFKWRPDKGEGKAS